MVVVLSVELTFEIVLVTRQERIKTKSLSVLFFRRLQAIATENQPQVLAIQYSDEEERGYDDAHEEGEGSGRRISKSSNEESGETFGDSSSDSSLQPLSPGEYS